MPDPTPDGKHRGPLSVGLIGAGRIGRLHADLLAHRVQGAALAGVYDAAGQAAREVSESHGVPQFGSADDLLEAQIDAVAICSSTDTHAEFVTRAALAGKAIFCEKPVSLQLDVLDRALDAVQRADVPFQVGFNRRFDPAHASVHAAVAAGRIGEPHLVRITSRDPEPPPLEYVKVSGGLFLDMSIHDFDMARYLTGSEVTEVFATGAVRVEAAFADVGDIDTALVTLVHENGCLTSIDNSRSCVYGYDQRIEIFGPGGMAASENPLQHSGIVCGAAGAERPPLFHFFQDRYRASFVREWEHFVRSVNAGEPSASALVDARAPLVIGLAAWRSVREARRVRVAEVEGA